MKTGTDRVDAVLVDGEAVGSAERLGSGAKILRGDHAFDHFLQETKSSDQMVNFPNHCTATCYYFFCRKLIDFFLFLALPMM